MSGNQYQQYKNIYIITVVAPIFVRINFRGFVENLHVHRHWISNLIKKEHLLLLAFWCVTDVTFSTNWIAHGKQHYLILNHYSFKVSYAPYLIWLILTYSLYALWFLLLPRIFALFGCLIFRLWRYLLKMIPETSHMY